MTEAARTPPQVGSAAPETPYVGLTPFTEGDAPFFFGRETERRLIAANLLASRLTLLYGASGVGKSSVIRAGVQRDFRAQAEQALASGRYPRALVVVFTGWRDDPIAGLADCVKASISEILGDLAPEASPDDLALDELLLEWNRRLDARALEVAGPSEFAEPVRTELLVVLDQFEQYFVYHPDEDGPGTFAVEFPRAVNREGLRANFLVSLREDAYTMLDRFEGRITNLFASNFRLEHLDEKAATAAIVRPVEKYNELLAPGEPEYSVEPELVDAVIKDVGAGKIVFGQAGGGVVEHGESEQTRVETPFLQLVMSRLWTEEKQQGSRVLRYDTLRRLGGAERIVRRHLDEAMKGLDEEERAVAARMFHQLVTPSGIRIVHSTNDLAGYAEVPVAVAEPILRRLEEERILRTIDAAPGETMPRFEIRHDVLAGAVTEWDRQYEEARRRAEDEARQREALADQRRRLRTRMLLALALVLAFLIPAVIGGIYVWSARSDVKAQRDRFDSKAKAEHAVGQLSSADPNGSVRLAFRAWSGPHPASTAEEALRSALAASERRGVLEGHTSQVVAAQFSPDGTMVATASRDGTARLWSTKSGQSLSTLVARGETPASVNDVAFSPQGSLLATVSTDHKARLWNVATGKLFEVLTGHHDSVNSVAFSPDGRFVITSGADWTPRIWRTDRPGHPLVRTLGGHTGSIVSASFSPDGERALTASTDGTARIWFLKGRRPPLILRTASSVSTAVFSRDGRKVVTGGADGVGRIWDARNGRLLAPLKGHGGAILDAAFSPTGRLLVTAGADGSTRLWRTSNGSSAGAFTVKVKKGGSPDPVVTAAFSRDGAFVITAQGLFARIWRTASKSLVLRLRGHKASLETASFSPDESRVVAASDDGTARIWDAELGKPTTVLSTGGDSLADMAIGSGTDARLVAVASGNAIQVWKLRPAERIRTVPDSGRSITSVAFSPDEKLVAATSTDGTTQVFETRHWRPVTSVSAKRPARDVAFSPDGKLIAVGYDRGARVWHLKDHNSVAFAAGKPVTHVAFSQDGERVLAVANDVYIRDLGSGKVTKPRHSSAIVDASFGPNGSVVAGAEDGTALIWNKHARVIRTMRRSLVPLVSVSRSKDGRFVVTASQDGRARIWEGLSGRLLTSLYESGGLKGAVLSPDDRFLITDSASRVRVHLCEVCLPIPDLLALGHWRPVLGDKVPS